MRRGGLIARSGASDHDVVEFSGFQLERARRRLLGPDGAPIALKPRMFDTLVFFLAHPGEVLDKRAILDAVWPNVIVEENNLNQAISALRRALGETREEPRFIATVPGRGYQFIAPVRTLPAAIAPLLPPLLRATGSKASRSWAVRGLALLGAAAALVLVRGALPVPPAAADPTAAAAERHDPASCAGGAPADLAMATRARAA
jgi:DNA-binding winged helix-turn-helix (wHTH) protein